MKKIMLGLIFTLLTLPNSVSAHGYHDSAGVARYIANEGVLVTHGKLKIIFDPLPQSGFGVYPEISDTDKKALMSGEDDFAGLDLIFISHAHSDHFSPEDITALMLAHQQAHLIAPEQAVDLMRDDGAWDDKLMPRITSLNLDYGHDLMKIDHMGMNISIVRIPHAGWPRPDRARVQNMLYRVSFPDGGSVIHMGDADVNADHFAPYKDYWAARATDLGLPPYWFMLSDEGRRILSGDINIEKSIGVHVPIGVPMDLRTSGHDYFSAPGETRNFGK